MPVGNLCLDLPATTVVRFKIIHYKYTSKLSVQNYKINLIFGMGKHIPKRDCFANSIMTGSCLHIYDFAFNLKYK